MFDRIIGVFRLDRRVFADVEQDKSATVQAAIVVAIVAAFSVVGTILQMLFSLIRGGDVEFGAALLSAVVTFVMTFIYWIIWAGVTYLIGTMLFKGTATMGEMLRVIGFAYAPRMLSIIPCIGSVAGAIWSLIAGYVAVKEGLDLDNTGTIVTIIVGWLIIIIIGFILGMFGLGGAMGLGAMSGLTGS